MKLDKSVQQIIESKMSKGAISSPPSSYSDSYNLTQELFKSDEDNHPMVNDSKFLNFASAIDEVDNDQKIISLLLSPKKPTRKSYDKEIL